MALTIKNIAEKTGVSYATISLARYPRIAGKSRGKVRSIVDELNNIPNIFGRDLQSNRNRLIFLLLNSISVSFFSKIIASRSLCPAKMIMEC